MEAWEIYGDSEKGVMWSARVPSLKKKNEPWEPPGARFPQYARLLNNPCALRALWSG